MREIRVRPYATQIIELFEYILDKHNIMIPDADREYNEGEAPIFGCTYFDLEDDIVNVLCEFSSEFDPYCTVELITEEY